MDRAEEYKSAEELREEIAELKIRLAFQEKFEDEVDQILAECEDPDPDMLKAIHEAEEGLLEEISRQYRKKIWSVKGAFRSVAGRVAAIVLVGVLISVSSAMAAIQMLRMGIFELDMQGDNRQMFVRMMQVDEVKVPEEWSGYYYPAFIPDGFEFGYIDDIGVWYFDESDNWIIFDENVYGGRKNIDTENAKVSNIQINGTNATVIEKDEISTVLWSVGKRYFVVRTIRTKEEAIRIAASVVMIR